MSKSALAITFATLFSTTALAQSLEEKQFRKEEDKAFNDNVKDTNKRCNADIAPSIDWSTWKAARDDSGHRAGAFCRSVYYGLNKVCSTDDGKASVAKSIKKVVCKGDNNDATTVELSGDSLVVHTSLTAKTDAQKVSYEYLMKNLK